MEQVFDAKQIDMLEQKLDPRLVSTRQGGGGTSLKCSYVYALYYPECMGGHVFYVGKGIRDRIDCHERETKRGVDSHKCRVIRKIWANGEQVAKKKLAFFETDEEAFQYEIAVIFLMPNLTNATGGGEGTSGRIKSERERREISQRMKGKAKSLESLRKRSTARKGKPAHNKGKPQLEAHRLKNSDSHKGITQSEEARRKKSEAMKGCSIEYRSKMSETLKGRVFSEDHRQKLSESQRGHMVAETTRHKLSEANKGKSHSEETRRKISEGVKQKAAQRRAQSQVEG